MPTLRDPELVAAMQRHPSNHHRKTTMPPKITVLTQENCQPCKAVKRKLDRHHIAYEAVDVHDHPGAAARVRDLGYQGTPVTIIERPDGTETAFHGFNPDALAALIEEVTVNATVTEP